MADVSTHFKAMPALAFSEALAKRLKLMASRGEIRAPQPLASASLLVAAIHSLAVFELMEGHRDEDMAHAVDLFVAALWSGLSPVQTPPVRKERRHGR